MGNASWVWGFVAGFGVMLLAHFLLIRLHRDARVKQLYREKKNLRQELEVLRNTNTGLLDTLDNVYAANDVLRAEMAEMAQVAARVHATNKTVAELRGALAASQATEKKLRGALPYSQPPEKKLRALTPAELQRNGFDKRGGE